MFEQFGQVAHNDASALLFESVGLAHAIDPDNEGKVASAPGLYSRQRVFKYDRSIWPDSYGPGAGEERVGRRLAVEVLTFRDMAVDDLLEQLKDPGRFEHVAAVGARGHHDSSQPSGARGLDIADRSLVGCDAVDLDHPQHELVLAVAEPVDRFGGRRVIGCALRQLYVARLKK